MPTAPPEVLGMVRPDDILELDQKLAVPPVRVKVWVDPVETPTPPTENLVEFVDRLRRELEAAGHQFQTREKIDAEITALRDEWDERLDRLVHSLQSKSPASS